VRDANGVPTPFPIALVDRIYSEESGGTLWVWPPPLSNRGTRRDCPGEFSGTLPVPDTVTQVVDMGRRNLGQVCVLPSAKHLPLPLENPPRRRPAELLVCPIDFNQQLQILQRVLHRKLAPRPALYSNLSVLPVVLLGHSVEAEFCASSSEFTAVAVPEALVSPLVLAGVKEGRTHR
jgi:hypothetical protein